MNAHQNPKKSPSAFFYDRKSPGKANKYGAGYLSCFENSNYLGVGAATNGTEEAEDDDPFYEHYKCHKLTFIEEIIADPLNIFTPCDFAKEEIDDLIKIQMKL